MIKSPKYIRICLIMGLIIALRSSVFCSEQAHFSAEASHVDHPVRIPHEVLLILASQEIVRDTLESENIDQHNPPESWFSAAAVHLHSKAKDLVIVGNPPVSAGNTAQFWVFTATANGYRLVLATAAHDLIVEKSESHGYRDIQLLAMTASTTTSVLYRFDGYCYRRGRVTTR
jgi:hypothetical protein